MTNKISLKRPDQKESALVVRFSKNGIPFKFYPGKTIQTQNWSAKKQIVLTGEDNHQLINDYLTKYCSELGRIVAQFEAQQVKLNKETIQTELDKAFNKENTAKVEEPDFIGFYNQFISTRQHYKKATLSDIKQNRYLVICAMELATKAEIGAFKALLRSEKGEFGIVPSKKLPFDQVTDGFLEKFCNYLRTAKFTREIGGVECEINYKKNYIGKHTKQIKQVIRASFKNHVKPFDMSDCKAKFEEVDSVFTDIDELQLFVDLELTDERENLIRNKYVVNCFLGMRYSDFNCIKKHMFQKKTVEGSERIVYTGRQKKTDKRVEFPIHENAIAILEKYDYEMPPVNELEFNKVIKVIAEKAGLTQLFTKRETRGNGDTVYKEFPKYQLISSHTGRRSFCTIYYQMGWPIGSIMAISGHKTEQEFRKYVKADIRIEVLANELTKIPALRKAVLKAA